MAILPRLDTLDDHHRLDGPRWKNAVFTWTRWISPNPDWDHDHCRFCYACICNHRETCPEWKSAFAERGCYSHAFYAEKKSRIYIWVCRHCFKLAQRELGWQRTTVREVINSKII